MTNRIEEEAWKYIARIDDLGGAVKAVERGFIQQEIQKSSYQYQLEIESGKKVIVGVNKFQVQEKPAMKLTRIDPALYEKRHEELLAMKGRRDADKVVEALARVKAAASSNENLMPPIIEAVDVYATLGEVCDVLREVFGEYQPDASF
jgi:methylmalonyl-CoA mutase N-terminal domain/subunit